ncbi:MAG: deoxyguanosinetriphosphate triphosphohydrolase [Oscillospiraceae bacterium]|nr:deoxyguanosinetriphosphate triphosphohydrolase [Oscillospiraceae bacterium]
MTVREKIEASERLILSDRAVLSSRTKGRLLPEEESEVRTCFQRDVDRITHSKSFRRLMHKTQVFLQPEGDHYRTRLTHTLEVARIARTIARGLSVNEDLTEAIALGHDLGHTPFGHAGERALDELMGELGGFRHYEQSLRVVDRVEKDGQGLNLTYEVRNGILRHTNGELPCSLEGQIVRISDKVAYINADLDDAIRADILSPDDVPEEISCALGDRYSERIDRITRDIIAASDGNTEIRMSPEVYFTVGGFHDFMFRSVYKNPKAKSEETKVYGIIAGLFEHYMKNPDKLPADYLALSERDGLMRAVGDYVSGMTDKYAIYKYGELYIPAAWKVM